MSNYVPPVARLLELPEPVKGEPPKLWPDYVAVAGLGRAELPELLRLARDEALHMAPEETDAPWLAPVHAWRAIRQVLGDEAAEPLVRLLAENESWDSDWLAEDLVPVIARIGAPALPAIGAALAAPDQPDRSQLLWASCLDGMAAEHPALREALIPALRAALERHEELDPWANAILVRALVALKAVEAAALIEAAYEAQSVETLFGSDWPHVRFALGLGPEPPHTPSMYERIMMERAALSQEPLGVGQGPRPGFRKKEARTKAKAAKASRKKNRKR